MPFGRPEPPRGGGPRGGGWHHRPPEPPPPHRSLFGPGRPPRPYSSCCLGCCVYVLGAAGLLGVLISLLFGLL